MMQVFQLDCVQRIVVRKVQVRETGGDEAGGRFRDNGTIFGAFVNTEHMIWTGFAVVEKFLLSMICME